MKNQKWLVVLLGITVAIASMFFTVYLKKTRRDRNKNIISEVLYQEGKETWVKNSFYGLNFESPNSALDPSNEITDFELPGVKTGRANYIATGDMQFSVLSMELESEEYDLEKGMEGILTNMVAELNGTNLKYNFELGDSWLPYAIAEGQFNMNTDQLIFKAFLSFNKTLKKENNLRGLVIFGSKTEKSIRIINQSISSIDLNWLKKEKNRWMFYGEKDGQKFRNYKSKDTTQSPNQINAIENLKKMKEKLIKTN